MKALAEPALSQPFDIGGIRLPNRIMVSPMCTYSCSENGMATDWHFAHYARLAMGGAGLVMLEATSIDLVGRHSYADLGIWSDDHIPPCAASPISYGHRERCPRSNCSTPAARPALGAPGMAARR